jgi:hypothetical protein
MTGKKPKKPTQQERLAAALRENLKRRKAQQRNRGAQPAAAEPAEPPNPHSPSDK